MEQAPRTVRVSYALSLEARKVMAKKTGSLDPADAPSVPEIPGVALIPQKGDLLAWEALGTDLQLVVSDRLLRFRSDDSIEVTLLVDVPQPLSEV